MNKKTLSTAVKVDIGIFHTVNKLWLKSSIFKQYRVILLILFWCNANHSFASLNKTWIPETPIIKADSPTSVCQGSTSTLSVDLPASPNCAGEYKWSNGQIGTSVSISTSGSYSVKCEELGELSSASNVISVNIKPIPAAPTVSGGGDFCSPTTSTVLSLSGCSGTITWSTDEDTPTITVYSSGSYYAQCRVNDCLSEQSNTVNVNFYNAPGAPIIGSSNGSEFCQGENTTISVNLSSSPNCSGTYIWNTGQTGSSITVSSSNTYSVRCQETNCSSPQSNAITINAKPKPAAPTVSGGGDFCSPTTSTLLSVSGCSGTITWSTDEDTPTITVYSSGSYYAQCRVNGCLSEQSNTVNVNFYNAPGAPIIGSSNGSEFCQGENTTISVNSSSSPNCSGTYIWNTGQTGSSITVSSSNTYSVRCQETNCSSPQSNAITINAKPIPAAPTVSGGGDFCSPTTSTVLSVSGCSGTISWSTDEDTPTITVYSSGSYYAHCRVNGCLSEQSNTVKVNFYNSPGAPIIQATNQAKFCKGGNTILSINTSSSPNCAGTYVWNNGQTGPSITVTGSNTYSVICHETLCSSPKSNEITTKLLPSPSFEIAKDDISCYAANDGKISITPIGGNGPNYSIQWKDTEKRDFERNNLKKGTYTFTVFDNEGCENARSLDIYEPTIPSASFFTNPITCFDDANGQLFLEASGGNGVYFYQLNGGAVIPFDETNKTAMNGFAQSLNQVIITDHRTCLVKQFSGIEFINPAPVVLNLVQKIEPKGYNTNDGSIAFSVMGGTGEYESYNWRNEQNQLLETKTLSSGPVSTLHSIGEGTYALQVIDSHGCSALSSEFLDAPSQITGEFIIGPVSCFGQNDGSLDINPSGGVHEQNSESGYSILWYKVEASGGETKISENTAAQNINAGNYFVTITDGNGISIKKEIEVTEPDLIEINLLQQLNNYCETSNKGILEIDIKGGTKPYQTSWSNQSNSTLNTDLPEGDYTVMVTDQNNCTAEANYTIEKETIPFSSSVALTEALCFGLCEGVFTGQVTGGIGPFTYSWENFAERGSPMEIEHICEGETTAFIAKDALGCEARSEQLTMTSPPENEIILDDQEVCPTNFVVDGTQAEWAVSYFWESPRGDVIEGPTLTDDTTGFYLLQVVDADGCQSFKSIEVYADRSVNTYLAAPSVAPNYDHVVLVDITEPIPTKVEWRLPPYANVISEEEHKLILQFTEMGNYTIEAFLTINGCVFPVTQEIEIISKAFYDDKGFPAPTGVNYAELKVLNNPIINNELTLDITLNQEDAYAIILIQAANKKVIFNKSYENDEVGRLSIPLDAHLSPGLYLVLLHTTEGNIAKRIVIR